MKKLISILLPVVFLLTGCATLPSILFPGEPSQPATEAFLPSTEVPTTEATTVPTEEPTSAPTTTPPTEPTEPVFDPYAIIDSMSVEDLVGQLFLARCPSDSSAVADLQTYHLGGYILFGRDFEDRSPAEVSDTIAGYQAAAAIPMLIAVDEEGGTVCRVSSQPAFRKNRFPSPRKLYDQGGLELLLTTEAEKCQLLASVGVNMNMAPVCDITTDSDSFMYSRSIGQSPEVTAECIAGMVQTMADGRIGSVLKHFPGYGNNTDTHVGIALDKRPLSDLESYDLIPFRAGIEAGCGAILISHTFVNCLDDQLPASLSPAVIGYLRQTLGFNGVVVTDDLVMQAITNMYGTGEAAVLAVLAGNDLLCSSEYEAQYSAVLEAVNNGRIPMEQVRASVARLLQWKHELGLIPIA